MIRKDKFNKMNKCMGRCVVIVEQVNTVTSDLDVEVMRQVNMNRRAM